MKWISKLDIAVHQTQYFKLENWKNPVQIDRGYLLRPGHFYLMRILGSNVSFERDISYIDLF